MKTDLSVLTGRATLLVLLAVSLFALSGCTTSEAQPFPADIAIRPDDALTPSDASPTFRETYSPDENAEAGEAAKGATILIDNKRIPLALEDSQTARAFAAMLPMDVELGDMNSNEKYVYLDTALPTNPYVPERIEPGDLMLYGNNCVVLFYKSFDSSYSYTRLGRIDDLDTIEDLAEAGSVQVTFERA